MMFMRPPPRNCPLASKAGEQATGRGEHASLLVVTATVASVGPVFANEQCRGSTRMANTRRLQQTRRLSGYARSPQLVLRQTR